MNGYFDDYSGEWIDTTDLSTNAIDVGTQGDAPQAENGMTLPDYGPISAQIPNITWGTGSGANVVTPTGAMGGAAAAVGAGVVGLGARIAPQVFNAIVKLSARLGGATGSVIGYGRRVWGQLSGWAAKNPGVSMISLLVSLGLTVEEAAHFISWGATTKRRRRARGITGRDVKTTRRTMRKLRSLNHLIATTCAPLVRHRRKHA
jgi:hypothetical protein